jgi:hypothetical protein
LSLAEHPSLWKVSRGAKQHPIISCDQKVAASLQGSLSDLFFQGADFIMLTSAVTFSGFNHPAVP